MRRFRLFEKQTASQPNMSEDTLQLLITVQTT